MTLCLNDRSLPRSSRKRCLTGTLFFSATLMAHSSSTLAVVMSDSVFFDHGGHMNNVAGTIGLAMAPHVEKSKEAQFDAVGHLGNCTGTWIGDATDNKTSYILTAARCVEGDRTKATGTITRDFVDRTGNVAAGGKGTFYLAPRRIDPPAGFGNTSTDLAVLALPKKRDIVDQAGARIASPMLYDGTNERRANVWFVGYGLWGTGTTRETQAVSPSIDERRAAGASRVERFYEAKYALGAPFNRDKGDAYWARPSLFDAGSAWWQWQGKKWSIIATQSVNLDEPLALDVPGEQPDPIERGARVRTVASESLGARVSKYVDWIRTIHPEVRVTSHDTLVLTSRGERSTANLALEAEYGNVAYVLPWQNNVQGPSDMVWSGDSRVTTLTVTVPESATSARTELKLRAWRDNGCRDDLSQMNDAVNCNDKRSGALTMAFDRGDNAHLPPGTYAADFYIEARGWHDAGYKRTVKVKARIVVE